LNVVDLSGCYNALTVSISTRIETDFNFITLIQHKLIEFGGQRDRGNADKE